MGKLIENQAIHNDLIRNTNYEIENRISELKKRLSSNESRIGDWQQSKFRDGDMTAEEYESIRLERCSVRHEINMLEEELENYANSTEE